MSHGDRLPEESSDGRSPIRPVEVLVVLAILLVLAGLFWPATMKVRDGDGNRTKCANNLKQIALATFMAEGTLRRLPPIFGTYGEKGEATLWYHLLPYIEEAGIYSRKPPVFDFGQNRVSIEPDKDDNAAAFKISIYLCPSDSSGPAKEVIPHPLPFVDVFHKNKPVPGTIDWGTNCYAANYLVFGLIPDARLDMSNTVFFSEKFPVCDKKQTNQQGGNLWAVPPFFPKDAEYRFNFGGAIGYLPSDANPTKPVLTTMFQVQPPPGQCDPNLAQSPHSGGMNVAMGDGSVRFLSPTISQQVWEGMLNPGR